DGIAGNAPELGCDLACRQSVGPQLLQQLDTFVSPAHLPKSLGRRRGATVLAESLDRSGQRSSWPDAYSPLMIYSETDPSPQMSYATIEKLQYGGRGGGEARAPASTSFLRAEGSGPTFSPSFVCGVR